MKKLSQPGHLGNCIGNGAILGFGAGSGDCILLLVRPGDQIVPKKHNEARGGLARFGTSRPICVGVDHQLSLGRRPESQAHVQRPTDVPENPLESSEIQLPWIMHVEADLLDCISNVWPGKGEVL